MMQVISDASVLIHLARAKSFVLLKNLYEKLVIATGVYLEVVERGWGLPGSFETENAIEENWLEVRSVSDKAKILNFIHNHKISLGNAETVQLAIESGAELVLADEVEVRGLLEHHNIKVRGCIGAVIEAARKGRIDTAEAKKLIRRLVETGYRIDDKVLNLAYRLLR